jgi:hypothetical protein
MVPGGADRPSKTIVQGDALEWIAQYRPDPRHALVASIPDSSELPDPAFEPWKAWFSLVVRRVVEAADPASPVFFYQSDVRHAGTWVDKGHLVQRAAEEAGAALLAHRIVCRKPAGTAAFGRATYSHLLLFSRTLRTTRRFAYCDVLPDGGPAVWVRGLGLDTCEAIVAMIRQESACDTLVHLFCGKGLLLEVARERGLHAIGIDLSKRQCRQAQHFNLAKFRASLPGRAAREKAGEPPSGSS